MNKTNRWRVAAVVSGLLGLILILKQNSLGWVALALVYVFLRLSSGHRIKITRRGSDDKNDRIKIGGTDDEHDDM